MLIATQSTLLKVAAQARHLAVFGDFPTISICEDAALFQLPLF